MPLGTTTNSGGESFSNPIAPLSSQPVDADEDEHRLTNDDFRSFLMTPRVGEAKSASSASLSSGKVRPGAVKDYGESDDPNVKRRKKKLYYAKLRQQEEERQKELAAKYRDRATERREGKNIDYQHNDGQDLAKTAEYRAVAPTADQVNTAAERRRLAIQESKFLGGDMEHTHLVKGLDFALLQKVRSEIAVNESEAAETESNDVDKEGKKEDPATEVDFVSIQGRKIYKAAIGSKPPQRNELFYPGRMAYVFNVEDDYEDSEIPTTTIRSKADCPLIENQTSLTTNDIVINKLTQILSYLRQGMRASKKLKKREKELIRAGKDPRSEDSIFGDIGDYSADFTLEQYNSLNTPTEEKKNTPSYFSATKDLTESSENDGASFSKKETSVKDFIKNINEKFDKPELTGEKSESGKGKKGKKATENFDSYAECYPGAAEMDDAVNDSDDDADYSKMDMGNKKGPLKRWDFETEDEYNNYMENKVAMPKAAFQFGIKMHEGRKTRTKLGPQMSEKQKLDREWQQISNLISKRKSDGGHGSGGKKSKD